MGLAAGARLGRYEIRSLLGRGGMGEVYCATDTQLGRTAAIKVLPPELVSDHERMRDSHARRRAGHGGRYALWEVARG